MLLESFTQGDLPEDSNCTFSEDFERTLASDDFLDVFGLKQSSPCRFVLEKDEEDSPVPADVDLASPGDQVLASLSLPVPNFHHRAIPKSSPVRPRIAKRIPRPAVPPLLLVGETLAS